MVLLNHCAPEPQSPWFVCYFISRKPYDDTPLLAITESTCFFQLVDKMRFPLSEFFFFSPNLTGTISLGFWQGVN